MSILNVIQIANKFWNSLDAVSRALNWTQLSLVLVGIVAIVLSGAQYQLGLRKDVLSGTSQKQKEVELNERVARASQDATDGIRQLKSAKTDLASMQIQFAQAAAEASRARDDLTAAREVVSELERKSNKLSTLSLRLEIVTRLASRTPDSMPPTIHYMDTGMVAGMVDQTGAVLTFSSDQSYSVSDLSLGTRTYSASLSLTDQTSIAGWNIDRLASEQRFSIAIGRYLDRLGMTRGVSEIESFQVFLIINGTELSFLSKTPKMQTTPFDSQTELQVIHIRDELHSTINRYRALSIK